VVTSVVNFYDFDRGFHDFRGHSDEFDGNSLRRAPSLLRRAARGANGAAVPIRRDRPSVAAFLLGGRSGIVGLFGIASICVGIASRHHF
jgi:hypothetical protein